MYKGRTRDGLRTEERIRNRHQLRKISPINPVSHSFSLYLSVHLRPVDVSKILHLFLSRSFFCAHLALYKDCLTAQLSHSHVEQGRSHHLLRVNSLYSLHLSENAQNAALRNSESRNHVGSSLCAAGAFPSKKRQETPA